jgi:hypothetical protein
MKMKKVEEVKMRIVRAGGFKSLKVQPPVYWS